MLLRRLFLLAVVLMAALPGLAQQPKMKLDSLGLPPYPGATNVGHIRLPLKDILKPKPGERPTGPPLTDLAIQTYRTPQSVSLNRIADFYHKYAQQLGWRLLDDIPDSSTNRSLVFWSPAAPGYLTVEILPGPENTRQIDLTRLLGEVDPSRAGEVLRLTGKRVREQRVSVMYAGRFLDLKTGKLVEEKLNSVEERSESGLTAAAAVRTAPMDETYPVVVKVTDNTRRMVSADVYTVNNALVAHGESKTPTSSLNLLGKLRATQGMTLRVVIMGVPEGYVQAANAAAKPTPVKTTPKKPAAAKTSAKAAAAPKPAPKPAVAAPAPAAPAAPPVPVVLSEWYGLRPPLTAMMELRRGTSSTQSDSAVLAKDVEVGSTCESRFLQQIDWETVTTDEFSFSPDLFSPSFVRNQPGRRNGSTTIDFALKSGLSNKYTLNQVTSTTTTMVDLGYAFNTQWVVLPGKKVNPTKTTYVVKTQAPPTVYKVSSGACPPPEPKAPAPAAGN